MIQDRNLIEIKSNINESITGNILLLNRKTNFSLSHVKSSMNDKLTVSKKLVSTMEMLLPISEAKKVKNP